jgi:UDP-N-acetylmuramate--alanine ligase
VTGADLVVVSAAVPTENPEREAATLVEIPVVSRGAMLAELARLKRAIVVVGSHGKTTTTAMVTVALSAGGLDPTAVIGGRLSVLGSNAWLGAGDIMVVEADESDRSFLHLAPEISVVTNIDDEHLEAYEGMDDLEASFLEFARKTPLNGWLIACADDARVRKIVAQVPERVVTYGLEDPSVDVGARDVELGPSGSRFRVVVGGEDAPGSSAEVALGVPGRHNVQNALAAFAVALKLGVPGNVAAQAFSGFTGADRRFQLCGEVDGVSVVDDYAHHPTEIVAALETARLRRPHRVRVVFQPHRHTRTLRLLDRLGHALASADQLVLTQVYAASEAPIPGATSEALAEAVSRVSDVPTRLAQSLDEAVEMATEDVRPGDLIVTLGAGSIATVPARIIGVLRERAQRRGR